MLETRSPSQVRKGLKFRGFYKKYTPRIGVMRGLFCNEPFHVVPITKAKFFFPTTSHYVTIFSRFEQCSKSL